MASSTTADGALKFVNTLTGAVKERYIRKLQCLHGGLGVPRDKLLCPYNIQWAPVEFGHLYVYFVETPGEYTHEAMKAYNYYYRLMFHICMFIAYPNCLNDF